MHVQDVKRKRDQIKVKGQLPAKGQPHNSCSTLKDRCSGHGPHHHHGPHSGHSQVWWPPQWPSMDAAATTRLVNACTALGKVVVASSSSRFCLNQDQGSYGLPAADVCGTLLGDQCPVEVDFPCQPWKYRTFNGYCNNVQNPRWGNANTRYLRFLPANYGDGVAVPRQATSGDFLPWAAPSAWPCTGSMTRTTSL
ncbi:Peroxidase [Chionoecetes opilio]|uniref:Peroxidase n=1 Tax=Chionoecetes opilio TaxID=41210 RepID=A0A8J5CGX6_CHIOP|nr:Peroxidase [Chionoecetes opilio]